MFSLCQPCTDWNAHDPSTHGLGKPLLGLGWVGVNGWGAQRLGQANPELLPWQRQQSQIVFRGKGPNLGDVVHNVSLAFATFRYNPRFL